MSHKQGAAETVRVQICISSRISSSLPLLATYAADRFIRAISPPHLSTNGTGREEGIHLAKKNSRVSAACLQPAIRESRVEMRFACRHHAIFANLPPPPLQTGILPQSVVRWQLASQTGAPCGGGRRRAKMGGC